MHCSQQESKFYPAQAQGDHYKRGLEINLSSWVISTLESPLALLHMEPFTPVLSGDKMLPIWILYCLAPEVAFYIWFAFAEPDCSLIPVVAWALQQGSQISCLRFVIRWLRAETPVFSMGRENQLHMPGISDSLNANLGVALTLLGWKGREEKYKIKESRDLNQNCRLTVELWVRCSTLMVIWRKLKYLLCVSSYSAKVSFSGRYLSQGHQGRVLSWSR